MNRRRALLTLAGLALCPVCARTGLAAEGAHHWSYEGDAGPAKGGHFHRPSEHLIAGKNFPMEAHFVHRADGGGLAVVGVLMATGKANAAFSQIAATMPAKEGEPVKADGRINPNTLLPASRGYYRYS